MEIPLLGREYAFPLLEALEKKGRTTFTGLLTELELSRATLSATLQDLVDEGYVQKETVGKYSVYRLKEKGFSELTRRSGGEHIIERLALHIYDKMNSQGRLERWQAEREEILDTIREKARQLVEQVATSVTESLREKDEREL